MGRRPLRSICSPPIYRIVRTIRAHLGAVPAEALDTFADLADPALEVGDEAPLVTLTLDELDDGVSIVDLERGEVGRGADVVELTRALNRHG